MDRAVIIHFMGLDVLKSHFKLEGMVDSARKNLKGWLTQHGKFVLTRHGKN